MGRVTVTVTVPDTGPDPGPVGEPAPVLGARFAEDCPLLVRPQATGHSLGSLREPGCPLTA